MSDKIQTPNTRGRYWRLKNDGATTQCHECGARDQLEKFFLCETPNGRRRLLHPECVDEDWLKNAEDMGQYPD